jgi:predicted nucleic-acid-binding protein
MTGLDTNVLVRFIVKDDAAQAEVAVSRLQAIRAAGEKAFINSVVLCETLWVLDSVYGYSRDLITQTVERMLRISHFKLQDGDLTRMALHDFRLSKAGFADCLIGRINAGAGCGKTLSFDQTTARLPHFEVL